MPDGSAPWRARADAKLPIGVDAFAERSPCVSLGRRVQGTLAQPVDAPATARVTAYLHAPVIAPVHASNFDARRRQPYAPTDAPIHRSPSNRAQASSTALSTRRWHSEHRAGPTEGDRRNGSSNGGLDELERGIDASELAGCAEVVYALQGLEGRVR